MKKIILLYKFQIIIFLSSFIAAIVLGIIISKINPFTNDIDKIGEIASNFSNSFDLRGSIRRAPVYPFLLGIVFSVFGQNNQLALIVFHSIVVSFTGLLVYSIAKRIYKSQLNAAITGMVFVLNPFTLWYVPCYYIEVLFTLLILSVTWIGYLAYKTDNLKYASVFGILLGITALTKAVIILLPFALAIVLYFSRLLNFGIIKDISFRAITKTTIVATILMLFVILPWTIRNKNVSGEWVLVSSNLGIEFFRGTVATDGDSYKLKNGLGPLLSKSIYYEKMILDSLGVNYQNSTEVDAVFNPMMKSYIMETPDKFIIKIIKGIPAFWNFSSDFKTALLWTIISIVFIFLFLAEFRRKPTLFNFFILILILYFNLLHAAIYSAARYSYPLFALMVIPGVHFIYQKYLVQFLGRYNSENSPDQP